MTIKQYIPGLAIVVIIAFFSYYLSTLHASFDSLVIPIIIGMFFSNVMGGSGYFKQGIELSIKIFLPAGIALYGSQLVLAEMAWSSIFSIFLVFLSLFGLTLLISRVFGIDRKMAILLASGLSICGASAIAVISPLIGARREHTSIAIISVMMLGLTGMIFYPILYDFLSLTTNEFNFLTGTTLPMLGQVKVAAATVCPDCLSAAIKIKLIRISFLFFLVTTAIVLSGKEGKRVNVPWFVIVFVVLALVANLTGLLSRVAEQLKSASGFFLSAALAAIGFSIDLDAIIEEGVTPLGIIFTAWVVTILLIFFVRNLF